MDNQNAEEVRGLTGKELRELSQVHALKYHPFTQNHAPGFIGAMREGYASGFCSGYRRAEEGLLATIAAQSEEVERLRATNTEQFAILQESVRLGLEQAEEYDRFWEAMGVLSEDITVDDAIMHYKSLTAEVERLQTELHDVREAVVDQCGPIMQEAEPRRQRETGERLEWVCVACGASALPAEEVQHYEGCIYNRSRQALAAEGGEGA